MKVKMSLIWKKKGRKKQGVAINKREKKLGR